MVDSPVLRAVPSEQPALSPVIVPPDLLVTSAELAKIPSCPAKKLPELVTFAAKPLMLSNPAVVTLVA